jgi:hypothetical protein
MVSRGLGKPLGSEASRERQQRGSRRAHDDRDTVRRAAPGAGGVLWNGGENLSV